MVAIYRVGMFDATILASATATHHADPVVALLACRAIHNPLPLLLLVCACIRSADACYQSIRVELQLDGGYRRMTRC